MSAAVMMMSAAVMVISAARIGVRPGLAARRALTPSACAPLGPKDALLSECLDGFDMDERRRMEVGEILTALERTNPTTEPSRSRLLNGVWELQFAGAPGPGLIDSPTREIALALYSTGYSAGALVQFLKKLPPPLSSALSLTAADITITSSDSAQPRVTTTVSFLVRARASRARAPRTHAALAGRLTSVVRARGLAAPTRAPRGP
jgi:hypothetical protein